MADRPGGGRVVSHRAQALVGGKHHELTCARSSARQDCRIAITMAVLQNEVNGMRKQISFDRDFYLRGFIFRHGICAGPL